MWTYAAKDMATLTLQHWRHPEGIREEERFSLEERLKRVRGNDTVPGREEPHTLGRSTKSRKERVRPRAGKDRIVELKILNSYRLIRIKEGDEYNTAFPTRYWQFEYRVMLFGLTNTPATTPHRGDKSSAEQRPLKRGMTLPAVPEWKTRVHLMTAKSSGTRRAGTSVPEKWPYAPSIWEMRNPLDISRSANIITIPNQLPESLPTKLPESLPNGLPRCLQSCRPRHQPESHQGFLPKDHNREAVYVIIMQSRCSEIQYNAASESESAPNYTYTDESQFQSDDNPESRLHRYRPRWQSTNPYDGEVVDGAPNFQKEGDSRVRPVKSYRQVKSPCGGILPKHAPRSRSRSLPWCRPTLYWSRPSRARTNEVDLEVYREVDLHPTEAADRECAPMKST